MDRAGGGDPSRRGSSKLVNDIQLVRFIWETRLTLAWCKWSLMHHAEDSTRAKLQEHSAYISQLTAWGGALGVWSLHTQAKVIASPSKPCQHCAQMHIFVYYWCSYTHVLQLHILCDWDGSSVMYGSSLVLIGPLHLSLVVFKPFKHLSGATGVQVLKTGSKALSGFLV